MAFLWTGTGMGGKALEVAAVMAVFQCFAIFWGKFRAATGGGMEWNLCDYNDTCHECAVAAWSFAESTIYPFVVLA